MVEREVSLLILRFDVYVKAKIYIIVIVKLKKVRICDYNKTLRVMSRIGSQPIEIPQGVEVKIEGQIVTVKGPKGELLRKVQPDLDIQQNENKIIVTLKDTNAPPKTKALWGTTRTLIQNMVIGVTEGFEKKLEIEGLGYKGSVEGKDLTLQVGFTHPVKIEAPEGIKFSIEKNVIIVSGIDKELVGQTAARIKKVRKPEPYKGKGIRYMGEVVRRKAGKKVVTAG